MKEEELKDILMHAIVHDLAAPLHSILGALSLLSELGLDEVGARWTRIALTRRLASASSFGTCSTSSLRNTARLRDDPTGPPTTLSTSMMPFSA